MRIAVNSNVGGGTAPQRGPLPAERQRLAAAPLMDPLPAEWVLVKRPCAVAQVSHCHRLLGCCPEQLPAVAAAAHLADRTGHNGLAGAIGLHVAASAAGEEQLAWRTSGGKCSSEPEWWRWRLFDTEPAATAVAAYALQAQFPVPLLATRTTIGRAHGFRERLAILDEAKTPRILLRRCTCNSSRLVMGRSVDVHEHSMQMQRCEHPDSLKIQEPHQKLQRLQMTTNWQPRGLMHPLEAD